MLFQKIAGENNTTKDRRDSFSHYYVPNVRIKDFSLLNDGKGFFDLPVKNVEQAYENIIYNYTAGNLLDFAYFKRNCRLIEIDLSKQTKLKDPKQTSFIGKLSNTLGVTMFFVIEKSEETTFNFSQNSVTVI